MAAGKLSNSVLYNFFLNVNSISHLCGSLNIMFSSATKITFGQAFTESQIFVIQSNPDPQRSGSNQCETRKDRKSIFKTLIKTRDSTD